MLDEGFGYLAVIDDEPPHEVTSIIAHFQASSGPLLAVIWDVRQRAWVFNSNAAAPFLFDNAYFDQAYRVDRTEAERLAEQKLRSQLPSDHELRRLCAEGLAAWSEVEDLSDEFDDEDDWLIDMGDNARDSGSPPRTAGDAGR